MEMTEFEKLLDSIDAAYIAHNDYFKANESNLDDQRLAEFEEQIDEAQHSSHSMTNSDRS